MSWLTIPQVSQGDTKEVAEAMDTRVVTVVVTAFTVKTQMPFSWDRQKQLTKSWQRHCRNDEQYNKSFAWLPRLFFFDKLATNTLVFNSLKTAEESALSGNLRKGKESALLVIVTSEFNPLPKWTVGTSVVTWQFVDSNLKLSASLTARPLLPPTNQRVHLYDLFCQTEK